MSSKTTEQMKDERHKNWEERISEVKKRMDAIGGEMDESIIDTVAGLNLHGFPTSQSCEGHLEHGLPVPWVMVEAEHEPEERYENEKAIFQKYADENSITVEQLKHDEKYDELWTRCLQEIESQPPTYAYLDWKRENEKLKKNFLAIAENYYSNEGKEVPEALRLKTADIGDFFRAYVGSDEDYDSEPDERQALSQEQKDCCLKEWEPIKPK